MRRFACASGNQKFSTSPWSVDGGMSLLGNWASSTLFCGPGTLLLRGLFLIAAEPCGGLSELPTWAARAALAVKIPLAVTAAKARRDTIIGAVPSWQAR
jgi:hypothetical protein